MSQFLERFLSLTLCVFCLTLEASAASLPYTQPQSNLDHSPVSRIQEILSPQREVAVLENKKSVCSWSKKTSTCKVSLQSSISCLRKSDDAFARYIAHYMECQAINSRRRCRSKSRCLWDDVCVLNLTANHEDSPCLSDAPAFTAMLYTDCSPYRNFNACRAHPPCDWYAADGCFVSFDMAYIGVPAEEDYAAREMIEGMLPSLAYKEFGEIGPKLDFDRMLKWTIPDIVKDNCNANFSEAACAVEYAAVAKTMPGFYYCTLKYKDADGCNADPVCVFDAEYKECWRADLPSDQGIRFKAMLPYIKHGDDRKIVEMMANCSSSWNKTDCEGFENCVWDPFDQSCSPRNSWVHDLLSSKNETNDPVCKFLDALADTDCGDIDKKSRCLKAVHCIWTSQNCEVATDYLIEMARLHNRKLEKSYGRLQKKCMTSSYKKCNAA